MLLLILMLCVFILLNFISIYEYISVYLCMFIDRHLVVCFQLGAIRNESAMNCTRFCDYLFFLIFFVFMDMSFLLDKYLEVELLSIMIDAYLMF